MNRRRDGSRIVSLSRSASGFALDGLGTVAFRILDIAPDQAVAVAQGLEPYRVYTVGGEADDEVAAQRELRLDLGLCPYMAHLETCDPTMDPAAPS